MEDTVHGTTWKPEASTRPQQSGTILEEVTASWPQTNHKMDAVVRVRYLWPKDYTTKAGDLPGR